MKKNSDKIFLSTFDDVMPNVDNWLEKYESTSIELPIIKHGTGEIEIDLTEEEKSEFGDGMCGMCSLVGYLPDEDKILGVEKINDTWFRSPIALMIEKIDERFLIKSEA